MDDELPQSFNVAAYFLDAPAALYSERIAIVGEPSEVSYGELAALANRAGNALRALGVSRGDRVLIVLPDSAEFVAAFFGAAKIGALAVPVNPFARSSDYIHYLENCQPTAAIVDSEALAEFLPASNVRPQIPIVVTGGNQMHFRPASRGQQTAPIAPARQKLAAAANSPPHP